VSWPEIARYHDVISSQLGAVTVATIHQRLRDEQGLTASLASLRRSCGRIWRRRPAGRRLPGRGVKCRRARRARSTTGYWAAGSTRWPTRRVWAFVLGAGAAGFASAPMAAPTSCTSAGPSSRSRPW